MARKPSAKSSSGQPKRAKVSADTIHNAPAVRLLYALTSLETAFQLTGSLQKLVEKRKRTAQTQGMLEQVLTDSINAKAQHGLSLAEGLEEIRGYAAEPKPDPHRVCAEGLAKVLEGAIQHCESVRKALRDRGGAVLDAVLEPNARGQRRSLEAHTKVQQAEGLFQSLLVGLSLPTAVLDEDVAQMIDLAEWFQGVRGELRAVLELHGTEPPPTKADSGEGTGVQRKSVGSGMKVEEAIPLLEDHVRAHDGVYPSVNKLAKIIGCSRSTINTATDRSPYLKARRAEADDRRINKPREVQLDMSLDKMRSVASESEESSTGENELDELIREQAAEIKREGSQHTLSKRIPKRNDR